MRSLQVIEEYIPSEVLRKYKQYFYEYDHGVGVIKIKDVTAIASEFGKEVSQHDVLSLLQEIDFCNLALNVENKFVDFSEFIAVMSAINVNCIPEEEMKKIFTVFDQDGDGMIASKELGELMAKLGMELTGDELEEMMMEADRDGDGFVSYHEFLRLMTDSHENETITNTKQIHTSISTSMDFPKNVEFRDENDIKIIDNADDLCCSSHENVPEGKKRRFSTLSLGSFPKLPNLTLRRKTVANINPEQIHLKKATKAKRRSLSSVLAAKCRLSKIKQRNSY